MSLSKIWMRLFERSATNSRPWESSAERVRTHELARSASELAVVATNLPLRRVAHQPIAVLLRGRRPRPVSVGDEDVAVAATARRRPDEGVGAGLDTPACPSVSSSLPSGLNLNTRKPRPAAPATSANGPLSPAQMLPSRSRHMPCARDEHALAEALDDLAGRHRSN